MKKLLMVLLLLLTLVNTACIAADDGCRVDEYGCWVTDEDGNKMYIMFWSEPARKYIMGDLSEPGTALVDKPAELDFGMAMVSDPAPIIPKIENYAVPSEVPFVIPTIEPIPTAVPIPESASCIESVNWLKEKFGGLADDNSGEINDISTANEDSCIADKSGKSSCVKCIVNAVMADKSKWNTYNSWSDFNCCVE